VRSRRDSLNERISVFYALYCVDIVDTFGTKKKERKRKRKESEFTIVAIGSAARRCKQPVSASIVLRVADADATQRRKVSCALSDGSARKHVRVIVIRLFDCLVCKSRFVSLRNSILHSAMPRCSQSNVNVARRKTITITTKIRPFRLSHITSAPTIAVRWSDVARRSSARRARSTSLRTTWKYGKQGA
jgi:hypothetical protein